MPMKVISFNFSVRVVVPDTGDPVFDALSAIDELTEYLTEYPAHEVLRTGREPPLGCVELFEVDSTRAAVIDCVDGTGDEALPTLATLALAARVTLPEETPPEAA